MASAAAASPKVFLATSNPGGESALEAGDIELANKLNSLYFEAPTMRELYTAIQAWQVTHRKRLLNLQIQREGELLCCIALTNPTEVIITSGGGMGAGYCNVSNGALRVETKCVYIFGAPPLPPPPLPPLRPFNPPPLPSPLLPPAPGIKIARQGARRQAILRLD